VGADKNLLVMDHAHTFINIGGQIGDFQLEHRYMALVHFLSTNQLKTYDKARNAVALALSPAVRALVDPDGAMSDIWNLDSTLGPQTRHSHGFCIEIDEPWPEHICGAVTSFTSFSKIQLIFSGGDLKMKLPGERWSVLI
ncbi:hypothetical protein F2P56_019433, partial [Juglans regia]